MSAKAIPDTMLQSMVSCINRYPLHHDPSVKPLAYGTAGFRTTGELLPPVAARVVILAVLRAWKSASEGGAHGATVGFMITASHNPPADNGFKIIDVDGGMLAPSWEPWCTRMANAVTGEDLAKVVQECVSAEEIIIPASGGAITDLSKGYGIVQLGRDTRATGDSILAAAKDVLDGVLRVAYADHGIVTTPHLHFIVYRANEFLQKGGELPKVDVSLYSREVLTALDDLMTACTDGGQLPPPRRIVVDAANGVGCNSLQQLLAFSKAEEINGKKDVLARHLDIVMVNTDVTNPTVLNNNCGAEFAHKQQRLPAEMLKWVEEHAATDADKAAHFYCLDGDADRVISFAKTNDGQGWSMIDGDRIAILYSMLLHHWLGADLMRNLDVGVVQTAYANGASTRYVKENLGMTTYMAATGVKNLHPVAHARDIGVYFEANGHGTVLMKPDVAHRVSPGTPHAERLEKILDSLSKLASQVCGDAITDMFLCELALRVLKLTPAAWVGLYEDYPSLQTRVTVPDPRVITNTKDETRALSPAGLQEAIDEAVQSTIRSIASEKASARAFVRPSGTEPIVRVYAESSTREATDALATKVQELVSQFCGH